MNFTKPSASNLERSIVCPPSVFLSVRTSSSNPAAEKGTAIHSFVDNVCMGMSRTEALVLVEEKYKEICIRISTEFLENFLEPKTELSFGVDFSNGNTRYLGSHLGRNYPELGEAEFSGTLDIVGINKKTLIPVVVDIKSGMEVTAAEHNWQIRYLVYAAHKFYGYQSIEGVLIYVRESEDPFIDSYTFSLAEIEQIGLDLKKFYTTLLIESAEYATTGKLHLRESDKCNYCPVLLSCPAKIGAIQALAVRAESSDINNIRNTVMSLSPDQAAIAWTRYRNMKNYWYTAEKAMKEYATKYGIEGDDFEVSASQSSRTSLDTDKLIQLARKAGVTDDDLASCRTKNTFSRVTERKKKVPKKEKILKTVKIKLLAAPKEEPPTFDEKD